MFQFGLFSTHIPYVITIVVYLLSYGYYALNKPEPSSESTIAQAESGNHLRIKHNPERLQTNAFHFEVASKADTASDGFPCVAQDERFGIATANRNDRLSSLLNTFELLSRPPTHLC